MMASSWPSSTAWAAAAVTWASTLPAATAMPGRSPVHAAASVLSEPTREPSAERGNSRRVRAKSANWGFNAARYSSLG